MQAQYIRHTVLMYKWKSTVLGEVLGDCFRICGPYFAEYLQASYTYHKRLETTKTYRIDLLCAPHAGWNPHTYSNLKLLGPRLKATRTPNSWWPTCCAPKHDALYTGHTEHVFYFGNIKHVLWSRATWFIQVRNTPTHPSHTSTQQLVNCLRKRWKHGWGLPARSLCTMRITCLVQVTRRVTYHTTGHVFRTVGHAFSCPGIFVLISAPHKYIWRLGMGTPSAFTYLCTSSYSKLVHGTCPLWSCFGFPAIQRSDMEPLYLYVISRCMPIMYIHTFASTWHTTRAGLLAHKNVFN